ncbi:inner membrane protein [Tsukamurella pulmonis]|uniref:YbaN family protein n=1 Tax=Tsukamurella pulmonis TaxID=47312 RepID=UPI001EDD3AFC|nr:YbaN family protein [Tsukamurella pulmonis]BDD83770.1 inner membrane protein [Tsukamurella pulmonis]
MAERPRLKWMWWLLAYIALGLGIIGVIVPLMPTTVFILIAAYCAARGSDTLHRKLLEHRIFGPMILDWQRTGAVSRKAKYMAIGSMAVCAVILFLATPKWWIAAIGTTIMAIVAIWLWSRPEPSDDPDAAPGDGAVASPQPSAGRED